MLLKAMATNVKQVSPRSIDGLFHAKRSNNHLAMQADRLPCFALISLTVLQLSELQALL